jgi:hypothetical protein
MSPITTLTKTPNKISRPALIELVSPSWIMRNSKYAKVATASSVFGRQVNALWYSCVDRDSFGQPKNVQER